MFFVVIYLSFGAGSSFLIGLVYGGKGFFFQVPQQPISLTKCITRVYKFIKYQQSQDYKIFKIKITSDMFSQEQQAQKNQKLCIICEKKESSDLRLMQLFSDREHICMQCYSEQNQMIVDYKTNKPNLYPDYNHIIDSFYVGNEDSAIDIQTITNNKITAICVCGSYLLTPFQNNQEKNKEIPEKINYWKLDIADFPSAQILPLFDETLKWLNKQVLQNRNILVHCAAGASRSASFMIAYLMKYRKMSYEQAYKLVKSKRKIISPNSGFIKQLKQYQKILHEQNK